MKKFLIIFLLISISLQAQTVTNYLVSTNAFPYFLTNYLSATQFDLTSFPLKLTNNVGGVTNVQGQATNAIANTNGIGYNTKFRNLSSSEPNNFAVFTNMGFYFGTDYTNRTGLYFGPTTNDPGIYFDNPSGKKASIFWFSDHAGAGDFSVPELTLNSDGPIAVGIALNGVPGSYGTSRGLQLGIGGVHQEFLYLQGSALQSAYRFKAPTGDTNLGYSVPFLFGVNYQNAGVVHTMAGNPANPGATYDLPALQGLATATNGSGVIRFWNNFTTDIAADGTNYDWRFMQPSVDILVSPTNLWNFANGTGRGIKSWGNILTTNRVLIGIDAGNGYTGSQLAGVDICSGTYFDEIWGSDIFGYTRNNNTEKIFGVRGAPYSTSVNPPFIFSYDADGGNNTFRYGGGGSSAGITSHDFYAATNVTGAADTRLMHIDVNGVTFDRAIVGNGAFITNIPTSAINGLDNALTNKALVSSSVYSPSSCSSACSISPATFYISPVSYSLYMLCANSTMISAPVSTGTYTLTITYNDDQGTDTLIQTIDLSSSNRRTNFVKAITLGGSAVTQWSYAYTSVTGGSAQVNTRISLIKVQ